MKDESFTSGCRIPVTPARQAEQPRSTFSARDEIRKGLKIFYFQLMRITASKRHLIDDLNDHTIVISDMLFVL